MRTYWSATVGILFAWYRPYFGPEEKNGKNVGFGLPRENRKKLAEQKGKMAPNPIFTHFWAIFPSFRRIFSYFLGEAETYMFPISSYLRPEARNGAIWIAKLQTRNPPPDIQSPPTTRDQKNTPKIPEKRCGFFAYSWKLPARLAEVLP